MEVHAPAAPTPRN